MRKPELSSLRQRLQALQAEMARLLPVFLGRDPLLPAYLSYRPRTCGNPGCKCARGELHPAWIVQFSAGGRRQCRSVPKTRFEALKGPAEAYREFRAARARWNRLVREAQEVIEAIERCRTLDTQDALEKPSRRSGRAGGRARGPKEPAASRSSAARSSGSSMRPAARTQG